ncbi:MAG: SLC13 family permease [Magnetovibrionaceae bacterium]
MSGDIILVFGILAIAVALFLSGRVRLDLTAIGVILALILTGLLSPAQALSGFGSPLVVLIAGLFVVGEGLYRTGVAGTIGRAISRFSGTGEVRLVALMMPAIALLSAFMSSTGAVAIFIPIVISLAREAGLMPSRLLMPLSIAALIGGMLTLIGTPPNLAASEALVDGGQSPFGFFDFTPVGLVILGLGMAYILTAGRFLLPSRGEPSGGGKRKTLREFADFFEIHDELRRLQISGTSPLIGKSIKEIALRTEHRITVIALQRQGRLQMSLTPIMIETPLQAGDLLICWGENEALKAVLTPLGLVDQGFPDGLQRRFHQTFGAAETLIVPESPLCRKTISEAAIRARQGLNVLALRRAGRQIGIDHNETRLEAGDMLMLVGPWDRIQALGGARSDMVLLETAAEGDAYAPHADRAPAALIILAGMLGLMATSALPAVTSVLLAAFAMVLCRCVTMTEAYRTINWESLILIAGMLPLAKALQASGGATMMADQLIALSAEAGPFALLACLFVFTSVFSQVISNTATTVLVAPIALAAALELGYAPEPFLMGVAIAASTAFATPVASPVNTLVLGPGQYTFMDFVRVGVPLQVLALIISLAVIPIFFPFV